MPTILKRSTKNLLFVATTKKLFLAAIVAVFLTATATAVYANNLYFDGYDGYGRTIWLSCGSTAGNYVYVCEDSGCYYSDGLSTYADQECSYR